MINGGVKFFDQSFSLFRNGATANASSNTALAKNILNTNIYVRWESFGSNDLTTETINITLDGTKEIDRIFLTDFNFKEFTIQYHNGATFVDFANVIGVNGVESSIISETTYAFDTAYFEFDAVTTNQIQITVKKTQIADEEKLLTTVLVTKEIGTFQGFPRVKPNMSRNESKTKTLSKKSVIQKSYETNTVSINFKTHPFQNDLDILEILWDSEEPFLVWVCGGRTGTQFFKIAQKSWRLKDVFNMQISGRSRNEFEKGVYLLGFKKSIRFEEHI